MRAGCASHSRRLPGRRRRRRRPLLLQPSGQRRCHCGRCSGPIALASRWMHAVGLAQTYPGGDCEPTNAREHALRGTPSHRFVLNVLRLVATLQRLRPHVRASTASGLASPCPDLSLVRISKRVAMRALRFSCQQVRHAVPPAAAVRTMSARASSGGLHLRPGRPSDRGALWRLALKERLNPLGLDPERCMVAERGGRTIGVGQLKSMSGGRALKLATLVVEHGER